MLVLATAGPSLRAEGGGNPMRDPTVRPGSLFFATPLPRERMAPRREQGLPGQGARRGAAPAEPAMVVIRPKVDPQIFVGVFGDTLAALVGGGLDEVFADMTGVAVIRHVRPDSGLVRLDFHDWAKAARETLAGPQPMTAGVVMIGANDRQPIREGDITHEPLSDRWREIYRERIDALAQVFIRAGLPLIWVGNPPMQNTRLSADLIAINEIVRQRVERAGGIFVDLWPVFVDAENRFAALGPDVSGQMARLRSGDGVHFTRAGARKAAHFVDVALRRALPRLSDGSQVAAAPAAYPALPGAEAVQLPPELQPGGVERLIDQMARLGMGLDPIAPPVIKVKPAVGPVLPLTGAPLARGGELVGGLAAARAGPQAAELDRVFGEGRTPAPPPGRADDFRWPRP